MDDMTFSEKTFDASQDIKREQSTIAFPYLDLETAVEVARAVYQRSGLGVCELDELAAEMNQTVSGAFRVKTGAARIFELIEKEGKSTVKLSELGRQVVSPDAERAARAEAFMRVPLYSAIFDKYKGHLLPPSRALEREMAGLGVAPKQADKARQAFERSARQAGYFESGEDRLVRPKVSLATNGNEGTSHNVAAEFSAADSGGRSGKDGAGVNANPSYHPFVQGLLDELPSSDCFNEWSLQDQAEWLRAAASIFKLLSKKKGRIMIEAVEEKTVPTGESQPVPFRD